MNAHSVRARGQIVPLAVFFLLACAAVFYFSVNTGQLVTEKVRLTNAADAAAYSAGVIEARALNYTAYSNRAIVANQVAIAQTISLVSWANYFADVWTNLGAAATSVALASAPVPNDLPRSLTLAAVLSAQGLATILGGPDSYATMLRVVDGVNLAGGAAVTMFNGAAVGLQISQMAVMASANGLAVAGDGFSIPVTPTAQSDVATAVATQIDPAMRARIIPISHGFNNFTKRYTGGERSRLQEVVLASRDDFTRSRVWDLRGLGNLFQNRIERRGGTYMPDLDTWAASDDWTYRYRVLRLSGWRGRSQNIANTAVQVGPAGTFSVSSYAPSLVTGSNFWPLDRTTLYTGLQEVYDLTNIATPAVPASMRTGVSVYVTKPRARTLTAGGAATANQPTGRLASFNASAPGDVLAAVSRAEVFFELPTPAWNARRNEIASLYSPYWHVRLISPSSNDKAYVITMHQNDVFRF